MKRFIFCFTAFLATLSTLHAASDVVSLRLKPDVISLRLKAEQGDADAMCELGRCYCNGFGVEENSELAAKWTERAASNGCARAVGLCYTYGYYGVAKNPWNAAKWYRKAAEQGDARAMCVLGQCYAEGKGVTKDTTEAVSWYRKAAEHGDAEAKFLLGVCYADGEGIAKDKAEAVKWYRKAAEQGDANAQNRLGICYSFGDGVAANENEAEQWFRRAAEQGHDFVALRSDYRIEGYTEKSGKLLRKPTAWLFCRSTKSFLNMIRERKERVTRYREELKVRNLKISGRLAMLRQKVGAGDTDAMCELVWCCKSDIYRQFEIAPVVDDVLAHKWILEAASNGCVSARGICHQFGIGMETNHAEAVACYHKASQQGDILAQVLMGFCYYFGDGVVKNKEEAVKWFRKAADQGNAMAQFGVGLCCFVAKNTEESIIWYRKAANQGEPLAQCWLGDLYSDDKMVSEDLDVAASWYLNAADQGCAYAERNLGLVVAELYARSCSWSRHWPKLILLAFAVLIIVLAGMSYRKFIARRRKGR